MIPLLLVMASTVHKELRVHVDLIEHNTTYHIHTDQGAGPGGTDVHRLVKAGEYWNFWRFYPEVGRYHVMDFRGCGASDRILQRPDGWHLYVTGPYRKYQIIGRVYLETHCLAEDDPEVLDKKIWGVEKREDIPGIRWGPLTWDDESTTFVRSHEWSTSWVAMHKDGGLSIRSGMNSWIMGLFACDPLAVREASTSWLGKRDWSWPCSASEMDVFPSGSVIALCGTPIILGRSPYWRWQAEECCCTSSRRPGRCVRKSTC